METLSNETDNVSKLIGLRAIMECQLVGFFLPVGLEIALRLGRYGANGDIRELFFNHHSVPAVDRHLGTLFAMAVESAYQYYL